MPPSFVRQLRNNTAQSDGTTVKLGAHILAAVAARTWNRQIERISTLLSMFAGNFLVLHLNIGQKKPPNILSVVLLSKNCAPPSIIDTEAETV